MTLESSRTQSLRQRSMVRHRSNGSRIFVAIPTNKTASWHRHLADGLAFHSIPYPSRFRYPVSAFRVLTVAHHRHEQIGDARSAHIAHGGELATIHIFK